MRNEPVFGVLLFPGFELLDVAGPVNMLTHVPGSRTVTIAEQAGATACARGPAMIAEETFVSAPALDVLLVPGGLGTRHEVGNAALLDFLRDRAKQVTVLSSVCTGAGLLAKAGLLDGLRATTNKAVFAWPVSQGSGVRWVKEARWVRDGDVWTSSGVAAGMDMTLAMIAAYWGDARAEQIAIGTEYDWHRDAGWDPFARLHGLA